MNLCYTFLRMKIKLYNTLTRKIEDFKPIKPGSVGMYTCGMTVYDHTHIGHMRTYVNTDVLRRMLEYNSLKVKQVENVTDVGHLTSDADTGDDKLQKKARAERKTAWEIAKIYTKEFFKTMDALNVLRPHVVAPATKHIKEMIQLVEKLEKKGFIYIIAEDGVYFDTSKIPDYGKLAKLDVEGLKAGARIEMVPGKRNISDFALWKFSKKNEKRDMEWESPWAKRSFPGWHIECSAMGMKYLGTKIDIHTGGEDHIAVHHTNERAQNIAAIGRSVVNLWFHNIFLMVEGEKMSKSLGNFYWMKDIKERGFDPLALRYLFLTAHYRSRLNFTWKGLKSARNALEKLREAVRKYTSEVKPSSAKENTSEVKKYREKFFAAINNDLNTPKALAIAWKVAKSKIPDNDKLELLLDFDQVLGLGLGEASRVKYQVSGKVKELVKKREKLRNQKKWKEADEVRKKVEKLGWKIEDSKKGSKLKKV